MIYLLMKAMMLPIEAADYTFRVVRRWPSKKLQEQELGEITKQIEERNNEAKHC